MQDWAAVALSERIGDALLRRLPHRGPAFIASVQTGWEQKEFPPAGAGLLGRPSD